MTDSTTPTTPATPTTLTKGQKKALFATFLIVCAMQTVATFLSIKEQGFELGIPLLLLSFMVGYLLFWATLSCLSVLSKLDMELSAGDGPYPENKEYCQRMLALVFVSTLLSFFIVLGKGVPEYISTPSQPQVQQMKENYSPPSSKIQLADFPEYDVLTEDAQIFSLSLKDKQVNIYGDKDKTQGHIEKFGPELDSVRQYIQSDKIDSVVLQGRLKTAGFRKILPYQNRTKVIDFYKKESVFLREVENQD